jgi:hypothetical protein
MAVQEKRSKENPFLPGKSRTYGIYVTVQIAVQRCPGAFSCPRAGRPEGGISERARRTRVSGWNAWKVGSGGRWRGFDVFGLRWQRAFGNIPGEGLKQRVHAG